MTTTTVVSQPLTVVGKPTNTPRDYVVTGSVAGLSPNRIATVDGDGRDALVEAGLLIPVVDEPAPAASPKATEPAAGTDADEGEGEGASAPALKSAPKSAAKTRGKGA